MRTHPARLVDARARRCPRVEGGRWVVVRAKRRGLGDGEESGSWLAFRRGLARECCLPACSLPDDGSTHTPRGTTGAVQWNGAVVMMSMNSRVSWTELRCTKRPRTHARCPSRPEAGTQSLLQTTSPPGSLRGRLAFAVRRQTFRGLSLSHLSGNCPPGQNLPRNALRHSNCRPEHCYNCPASRATLAMLLVLPLLLLHKKSP